MPSLDEQRAIGGALRSLAGRIGSEVEHVIGLQGVKAALMSVLLTGEVRVKAEEAA
jgi:hypothetical protein